jgi:hypothetical protein
MPRCSARSFWAPRGQQYHEEQNHHGSLRFHQGPVVGVPIVTKVNNTLVSRLRRVASSYVGRLDTKNDLLEVDML